MKFQRWIVFLFFYRTKNNKLELCNNLVMQISFRYMHIDWIHSEEYVYNSFQIERNLIVATVFLLIMKQNWFRLILINWKNVATVLFLSNLMESEIYFSKCIGI